MELNMETNQQTVIEMDGENPLVDDVLQNAPVPYTAIDDLHNRYEDLRHKIEGVARLFEGDLSNVVEHFLEGNQVDKERGGYSRFMAENIFKVEGAIAHLNATFWQKAMNLTDVFDCMPTKRREEWHEAVRKCSTPEFSRDNVKETISDLLARRETFLAEKVDGVFRNLSRTHVTNQPEGFSARMILTGVASSQYHSTTMQGYIHDLRAVIARFLGQKEEARLDTYRIIRAVEKEPGQWFKIDGGAMRMKIFKNGNCHLDLHPDVSWRLNCMLHVLYPAAIPTANRTRPLRVPKDFGPMERTVSQGVRSYLAELRGLRNSPLEKFAGSKHALCMPHIDKDGSGVKAELEQILTLLGGVRRTERHNVWFEFDYDPGSAINYVMVSGCIPDEKASQYYPTPSSLAREVMEQAIIGDDEECLEPSAGQGGLARFMPKDRTTCVEINPLNCKVLTEQGFNVIEADFLEWARTTTKRFDKVVMNPPFSEGRWKLHLEAAASLLKPDGRIVAIVPGSQRHRNLVPGLIGTCIGQYKDLFQGTGVCVSLYVADKPMQEDVACAA